jgi:D-alanine-D-alanine ligase
MPRQKTRVLVLFGGRSSEHEVSILSAASIIAAFDRERFVTIPLAINRDGRWLDPSSSAALLPREVAGRCSLEAVTVSHQPGLSHGFDIAFPALHGPYGEDGTVQGLLEMGDVPYVGSGVLGSACGMDKDVMKRLFRESALPTLPHVAVWRGQVGARRADIERRIGYPAFVKPANLGSSVGIRRVEDREGLLSAMEYAWEFDPKIIVEPGVDAREIECAVLGNEDPDASLPGEVVTPSGFYDYETKYVTDTAELVTPADLAPDKVDSIRELAVRAFEAIGCAGLARVDFFVEKATGKVLLNEVNTMPGFTSISMFPRMWAASGMPYPSLIERLIELGMARFVAARSVRHDAK